MMPQHVDDRRTPPRLLVIQPDPSGPLDQFADWLAEAGLEVRVVQPFAGDALPRHLTDDGLLVLGGKMNVNDDERYPWLIEIRHLLRQAVELVRPTLGVCLGGQLLADAMGGSVVRGDSGVEAGVVRVVWTGEAESDALVSGLRQPLLSAVMHEDMIVRLPDGAVWLGRSDRYRHQAFRVGSCAWGIQFHPEASAASYRRWVKDFQREALPGLDRLRAGIGDFEGLDAPILEGTSELAGRFAALVSASAQQRPRAAPGGDAPRRREGPG